MVNTGYCYNYCTVSSNKVLHFVSQCSEFDNMAVKFNKYVEILERTLHGL